MLTEKTRFIVQHWNGEDRRWRETNWHGSWGTGMPVTLREARSALDRARRSFPREPYRIRELSGREVSAWGYCLARQLRRR
jgi:hypothetical protein